MQIQVHATPQIFFNMRSGPGADLLQTRAFLANNDGLLGIAFNIDIDVDIQQRRTIIALTLGAFNDLFDLHRKRVRKLIAHSFQCGLANEFCNHRFA